MPAGILLHDISSKPVFFANPSFPYKGEMMFSHCTAPSKMDGAQADPVRVMTHYESDFGAAPKVEMRKGMKLTALDPDFEAKRPLGFRGGHWKLCEGDYLKEAAYAAHKAGLEWIKI